MWCGHMIIRMFLLFFCYLNCHIFHTSIHAILWLWDYVMCAMSLLLTTMHGWNKPPNFITLWKLWKHCCCDYDGSHLSNVFLYGRSMSLISRVARLKIFQNRTTQHAQQASLGADGPWGRALNCFGPGGEVTLLSHRGVSHIQIYYKLLLNFFHKLLGRDHTLYLYK